MAYAQWPDREHWEHRDETTGIEDVSRQQEDCLIEPVKVIFTRTVTDDLFQDSPYKKEGAR